MKGFCYGWFLGVSVAAGCGAQTSGSDDPNNGGRTSWLRSCDESDECGSLACLANVCTRECTAASDCTDLDESARCAERFGDTSVCAAPVPSTSVEDYEPCGGKVCGETCRRCAPGDATCDELDNLKLCSHEGSCVDASEAGCDSTQASGSDEPAPDGPAPSGEALSCETLTAAPTLDDDVLVSVTNTRSQTVALASPIACAGSSYVAVVSATGMPPSASFGSNCSDDCHTTLAPYVCDRACPGPAALLVGPGETVDVPWSPRVAEAVTAPVECCTVPNGCGATCDLVRRAEPGIYSATLAVVALTEEEAEECAAGSDACEFKVIDESQHERVELDFEYGEGDIELRVP